MTQHAFIFPGQGSQAIGMLAELATAYPIVQETFAEASDILGYDLWQLTQDGPEETLNQTDKTQPILLASGVAMWRIWQAQGGTYPTLLAGHSFGEYTALVCAEAISYADGVGLARDRGQFMQEAVTHVEGSMAAVLGLEDATIIELCEQAAQGEVVAAVNFNAPGQVVIAGHQSAVDRTVKLAKSAGAKKAMHLRVSVPAHCALMEPAAEKMAQRLADVTINTPKIPILHNVDVRSRTQAADIRYALVAQLYNPVRWVDTIKAIDTAGVILLFECGPGKVLSGLNKRIKPQIETLRLSDPAAMDAALQKAAELTATSLRAAG